MDPLTRHKLTHAVTEYDRRAAARKGHNPYAVAHYLGAVERIAEAVDEGTPMRQAITDNLTGRLATAVLKSVGLPALTDAEARY
jgi:hypothetical protein